MSPRTTRTDGSGHKLASARVGPPTPLKLDLQTLPKQGGDWGMSKESREPVALLVVSFKSTAKGLREACVRHHSKRKLKSKLN